ncbi:MAG: DUF4116 domain-containing protein [Chlamydiae bacterium]|nr:DUF4116 domain-containing protein [Chlamydiota bacterium]
MFSPSYRYADAYLIDHTGMVSTDEIYMESRHLCASCCSTWKNFKDRSVECLSTTSSSAIRLGSASVRAVKIFFQIFVLNRTVDDKETALELVGLYGSRLDCVSPALKDDEELVLVALENNPKALEFASDRLKNNREFFLKALERWRSDCPPILAWASTELRKDRELVAAAVILNGYNLDYVDDSFKADREMVLAAIRATPPMFARISKVLQGDGEMVEQAVRADKRLLHFASAELKLDLTLGSPANSLIDQVI